MTSQPVAPATGNSYAPDQTTIDRLRERAQFIRLETIRLIDIAKTGHYTSVFSAAEVFSALYYDVMKLRKGDPKWGERDRFTRTGGMVGLVTIDNKIRFEVNLRSSRAAGLRIQAALLRLATDVIE
mgnify:CR=1 FL=1